MLPDRSLDGVYSGRNPLTDLDVEAIAALGCRIVVDLRQPREWEGNDRAGREALAALAAYGLERLHLPTPDGEAPADRDLAAALAVVEPAGRDGAGAPPVYVHCRAGQERTAAVLLAAHARRRGLSARAALAELQRADPRLRPLPWQVAAVDRFLREAQTPSTAV
jgi:protein-tyrosine phosphatase